MLVKLVLGTIALGALVVLLAGPAGAQEYPPSQNAQSAPQGPTVTIPTGPALPRTGSSSTVPMFWIGLGAFALGSVLVVGARRHRQVRSRHVV